MIFPKILSILSPAKTLPPIRDDLAIVQHHSYQIQRFTDPSYLAKRQIPVATLYWDSRGRIKAIFNLHISRILARILVNEGVNLGLSVLADLQRYGENSESVVTILRETYCAAQLGVNSGVNPQTLPDEVSIGLYFRLARGYRTHWRTDLILQMMEQWFARSGYITLRQQVRYAGNAGQEELFLKEGGNITERQTVGTRSASKFCELSIQNWPLVFVPGKLDKLAAPYITC